MGRAKEAGVEKGCEEGGDGRDQDKELGNVLHKEKLAVLGQRYQAV